MAAGGLLCIMSSVPRDDQHRESGRSLIDSLSGIGCFTRNTQNYQDLSVDADRTFCGVDYKADVVDIHASDTGPKPTPFK